MTETATDKPGAETCRALVADALHTHGTAVLVRERWYDPDDDRPRFSVAGNDVLADVGADVLRIQPAGAMTCADCGGRVEWAEAGGVPGSRRCVVEACESAFSDLTYAPYPPWWSALLEATDPAGLFGDVEANR